MGSAGGTHAGGGGEICQSTSRSPQIKGGKTRKPSGQHLTASAEEKVPKDDTPCVPRTCCRERQRERGVEIILHPVLSKAESQVTSRKEEKYKPADQTWMDLRWARREKGKDPHELLRPESLLGRKRELKPRRRRKRMTRNRWFG